MLPVNDSAKRKKISKPRKYWIGFLFIIGFTILLIWINRSSVNNCHPWASNTRTYFNYKETSNLDILNITKLKKMVKINLSGWLSDIYQARFTSDSQAILIWGVPKPYSSSHQVYYNTIWWWELSDNQDCYVEFRERNLDLSFEMFISDNSTALVSVLPMGYADWSPNKKYQLWDTNGTVIRDLSSEEATTLLQEYTPADTAAKQAQVCGDELFYIEYSQHEILFLEQGTEKQLHSIEINDPIHAVIHDVICSPDRRFLLILLKDYANYLDTYPSPFPPHGILELWAIPEQLASNIR